MKNLKNKSGSKPIPEQSELFVSKDKNNEKNTQDTPDEGGHFDRVDLNTENHKENLTQNKQDLIEFFRKAKATIHELITINEPGYTPPHNFNTTARKQIQTRTITYSSTQKPQSSLTTAPQNPKKNQYVPPPDINNDATIPKDVMNRSYKNPNFFSSAYIKYKPDDRNERVNIHDSQDQDSSHQELQPDSENKIDKNDQTADLTNNSISEEYPKSSNNIPMEDRNRSQQENPEKPIEENNRQLPNKEQLHPPEAFLHKLNEETAKRKIESDP